MQIVEKSKTKISIQPESKKQRLFRVISIFIIFLFFALIMPLTVPLNSTLTCDRANHINIRCQLQEFFLLRFTVQTPIDSLAHAAHKVMTDEQTDRYIQLQKKDTFLNFIEIWKPIINFPSHQGFIILSQKQEREIVKQINQFLENSTEKTLKIEEHSTLLILAIWLAIVAIAFFTATFLLIWPFKTYTFDKEQQKLIITTKIKFIGTTQTRHSIQNIHKIESVKKDKSSDTPPKYDIVLILDSHHNKYYLGTVGTLIAANQMMQSIEPFLPPKSKPAH